MLVYTTSSNKMSTGPALRRLLISLGLQIGVSTQLGSLMTSFRVFGTPGPAGPIGPINPGPVNQGSSHASGPPPHLYLPQGWGNTYPQWQPPAHHHPNKAATAATDPNAAWASYNSCYYQQPPGPVSSPVPATETPPAQGEPPLHSTRRSIRLYQGLGRLLQKKWPEAPEAYGTPTAGLHQGLG